MDNIEKLFPINLYHSYIIEGDPDNLISPLLKFFEDRGDIEVQSSNTLFKTYDSFGMDNVREIKEWNSQMSISEGKKFCIIGTKFINHDAEQTFLKILEDSNSNTHFFLIVPNVSILLDTIISRSHIIKISKDNSLIIKKTSNDFIKSQISDRIKIVAQIIEDYNSPVGGKENSGGLRYFAIEFINELEEFFYQKFKTNKNNNKIQFILDELSKSREYLSIPGCSVKMILENIALVI